MNIKNVSFINYPSTLHLYFSFLNENNEWKDCIAYFMKPLNDKDDFTIKFFIEHLKLRKAIEDFFNEYNVKYTVTKIDNIIWFHILKEDMDKFMFSLKLTQDLNIDNYLKV